MKIQELRDKMKSANREDIEKIVAELYKMIPKSRKESEADPIIEDIIAHKASAATPKSAIVDFAALKLEIETFISRVDDNLYYVPNRIIPKNKRSKWRFEVKNFVKKIRTIPADGENGEESARLLRELYKRLCYGCGYYIFPSEDPFNSIGIRQPDFYEMLVYRTFANGFTDEKLKNMLEDATLVHLDRNSLHIELEAIFSSALSTIDLKYKVIGFIMEYVKKYEIQLKVEPKKYYSDRRYLLERHIEEMCNTMLVIAISLQEPVEAIKYYWTHVTDTDKEITLYRILDIVGIFGDNALWIKVYEEALQRKIKPRESLQNTYKNLTSV